MSRALIIFSRLPVAGETKTRLMPALSPEECAALHRAMIADVAAAARRTGADIFVFHTPDAADSTLLEIFGAARYLPQVGRGLGERMMRAADSVLAMGYEKILLFGTDIPALDENIFFSAFESLDDSDVVAIPTEDGGYCLIGMKEPHDDLWRVDGYGGSSVFESLKKKISSRGLRAEYLAPLRDVDTAADLREVELALERDRYCAPATREAIRRIRGLNAEDCDRCGVCARGCLFLQRYSIVAADLARRDDLAFSCFLCGRCRELCRKNIDGSALARRARQRSKLPSGLAYRFMLWDKAPGKFADHKRSARRSVLFPGCSLPAFFPKTTSRLVEISASHDIGVVYDCCGKPASDLGVRDADDRARKLAASLRETGVEELVIACANCFYFFRDRIDIPIVSVYKKLYDLGEGARIDVRELFVPCPDRRERIFLRGVELFSASPIARAHEDVQCCGLGGAAGICEPETAKEMTDPLCAFGDAVTLCASCSGAFQRRGVGSAHVLSKILGVEERPSGRIRYLIARALRKIFG